MNLNPAVAAHIQSMPWDDFCRKIGEITDSDMRKAALRYRFRTDRAHFLQYCFPQYFSDALNGYHLDVLNREWIGWRDRENQGITVREADAAPRSFGKSTLAKGEMAWAFVYDMEAMAVIISNEQSLAVEISGDIRSIFLEPNQQFEALYGPFRVDGGVEKYRIGFPDGRWCAVRAKSMGSQLRGLSRGGVRPTIVLLDDAERSDRVRSPKQRRHWWETLYADILKLGKAKGGLYCRVRGTVLHPDSGLANLLKPTTPGWRARRFQAMIKEPERKDLWVECGAIYKNLTLGNEAEREDCALAFYDANKEEMDRGAVMLDPRWLSVFKYHKRTWDEGIRSVLQELQNEPRAAGTKFFQVTESSTDAGDGFARCRVVGDRASGGYLLTDTDRKGGGRKVPLDELRTYMRLDPIPGGELGTMGDDGGSGAGDFACIVVLGRDQYGHGYVLDVWLKRARDSEQIAVMWALGEKWLCEKATMESNGFQRLLGREYRRQQEERKNSGLFYQMSAADDSSSVNKEERIARLEGPITARWLQFAEHISEEALGHFDAFPDGDHDDSADAVEGAWRLSVGSRPTMSQAPLQSLERMGLRRA